MSATLSYRGWKKEVDALLALLKARSHAAGAISFPITVPQGGTGQVALNPPHAVLIAEGVAPVGTAGPGVAGQIFVSNGPAADPGFVNAPSWHVFTFLANATFTPTYSGTTFGEAVGGGGGGGGGAGGTNLANRGSGGGGGGAPDKETQMFEVVASTTYTITIDPGGAGGNGGAAGADGSDGQPGNATTIIGGAIDVEFPGGGEGTGGKLAGDAGIAAGIGGPSNFVSRIYPHDQAAFATLVTSANIYQPPGYGGSSWINAAAAQPGTDNREGTTLGGAAGASPNGIGGGGGAGGAYGNGTAGGAGGAAGANGVNAPAGPAANSGAGAGGGGGGGGTANTTGGNGAHGGSGRMILRAYF